MLKLLTTPTYTTENVEIYEITDDASIGIAYAEKQTVAVLLLQGAVGIGISKCMPTDKYSKEIGKGLALSRALRNIAERSEQTWLDRSITLEEWNKKHKK